MGVIDIMNLIKVKGFFLVFFLGACLTGAMIFIYIEGMLVIHNFINKSDYFLYDWKIIPLFLNLPAMLFFDIFLVLLVLPGRKRTQPFMERLMIPVAAYMILCFFISIILSFIISFCLLGSDYYKCDSTSIVSSGSNYAKSKEMCIQMKNANQG